jgi:hypothetical protein
MNCQNCEKLEKELLSAQAAIAELIKFGEILLARFESGIEGATEWGALKFAIEDAKKLDLSALAKVKQPTIEFHGDQFLSKEG